MLDTSLGSHSQLTRSNMRTLAALLAVATFVTVAACGSDGSTAVPNQASIAGTWNLQRVNGSPLPFLLTQFGPSKSEATSDQLTATGSTFTEVTQIRTTVNGQVTNSAETDSGTYVVAGRNVTLMFNSDGSLGVGTVSGDTLRFVQAGISLVYSKQ